MKRSKLSAAILAALTSSYTYAIETSLDPVYVTSSHYQQSSHTVTASSTIITADDIAANHYRTLDDALRTLPGINIIRNGGLGTSTSIQMRGQSNQSLLVLINGTEINNPMGTGGAIIGHLLLTDVERIEILKGPQSGIWGANASAGVINIITKSTQPSTQGSVNVEAGSFSHKKIAVNLSSATDEGDFAFSFSNLKTDGFSAVKGYQTNHDSYESDAFSQTDFTLNMGINLSNQHRIETLIKTANSYTEYDYTNNPNQTEFASVDYKNNLRKVQYLYNNDTFNSTLYASQNEIKQYNDAIINAYGLKGGYQYAKDQSLGFIASAKQYQNLTSGESYHNTGFGLSNTNQFNQNKVIITESLRADQYNQFDDKITGKIGLKNYFNEDVFISANIGTAYNAPTLFQLTYGATLDLQPEETKAFDINLGAYGFELSYYKSETENLIQYGGTWPVDYYENLTGTSTFEGIEASYSRYLESIKTHLILSLFQGSAKDDNNQWLARIAEQTSALTLSHNISDKLEFIANTRYIGTMYDKANQKGANIGNYFVTDISINYAASSSLNVYANVLNLFNEDYTHAVASYQDDGVTAKNIYSNGGTQLYIGIQGKL